MSPKVKPKNNVELLANRMTESVGSPSSLVIHTILFVVIFGLYFFGVSFQNILLVLTTAVSLEAIYLAIFIQMTVNRNTQSLEEVEEDIEEITEEVKEIGDDVQEIQKDVDEIQVDVDEVQKDIDELQEDVEEITEDEEKDTAAELKRLETLHTLEQTLQKLLADIEVLKKSK